MHDAQLLRPAHSLRAWWARSWVAVCFLSMVVASEYKWRVRPASAGLDGSLDLATVLEVAVYAVVAAYLLEARAPRLGWRRTVAPMGALIAYTAYLSASFLWSPYVLVAGVRAGETCIMLLLAWCAYRRATVAHLRRTATWFVALVDVSVAFGVVHPLPQAAIQAGRFTWLQVHPTTAAVFLGLAVVICAAFCLESGDLRARAEWPSRAYVGSGAVNAYALYVNHTRGVVVGVFAALVVLAALVRPLRRRVLLLAVLAWSAGLAAIVGQHALVEYAARGESLQTLATLNDRTSLWSTAYESVKEQPLFGYGLYASRGIFVDTTGLGGAHNAVVNVAVDLGLFGVLLWGILLVSLGRRLVFFSRAAPCGERLDRSLMLGILVMLFVDGVSIAGIGAVSNVGSMWLYLLTAWMGIVMSRRHVKTMSVSVSGRA